MLDFLDKELEKLKESFLYRKQKAISKVNGVNLLIDNKKVLSFCSNNYLGLANNKRIVEESIKTIRRFGINTASSRLISGTTIIHKELERKIAKLKKREAAIVFPTGYMANLGAISALTDEKDTIIIDRLNHASIIDACKLSKAKLQVYPHKEIETLKKILEKSKNFNKRLIITEALFSMDGDIAPLPQILELAKRYNAITMVDEAHSTGILGKTGSGIEEYFGIEGKVDIIMGTLSKAIGSLGGFVSGSYSLIDFLTNKARSFIYTTALPPFACAAAIAAIEIIENSIGPKEKLWENIAFLRANMPLDYKIESQIIPIIIKDEAKTMKVSEDLFNNGIFVQGIRYPTVNKGKARLRISLTSLHQQKDLIKLVSALKKLIY